MSEETSFLMAISAIGASFFMMVLGWLPTWIFFGTLVVAALLYNTKYLATGTITGFTTGILSALTWFPLWAYFTGLIIATILLASRIADRYVNTGVNK